MEASSLADLVISSTSLVNQRRNSKDDRIYRSGTPRRNINNETQEYRNTNWVSRLARITTGGVNHLQARGKIRRGRDFRKDGNKEKRRGSSERRFTKSPSGRTQQERSTRRAKGSPIRMTGCVRCSFSNHKGEVCPRFDYWKGSRCKHCFYLHHHNLCPYSPRIKWIERLL